MELIRQLRTRKDGKGRTRSIGLYMCNYCQSQVERRTPNKNKSCGCAAGELTSIELRKHGETETRLYHILEGMKARCYNENHMAYKRYGGRGIAICSEWHDYQTFREWAINNGYRDYLTIDRIGNDGNYEPSNCRWITNAENGRKGNEKFTMKEAMEIRKLYLDGMYTQERIADIYGASSKCIGNIVNFNTYKEGQHSNQRTN